MRKTPREKAARTVIRYPAEDDIWGIPESPEFSVLHHLIHEFKHQEAEEERCLELYRRVAEESEEPTARFLLNMIIADEERHHDLLDRSIAGLKDDLGSTRAVRSATPRPDRAAERELALMIERFMGVERNGIRVCEKLKKTSRRFRQELLALFCKAMIYDSLKHIAILKFLQTELEEHQERKTRQTK
jgi:hypothetical protein